MVLLNLFCEDCGFDTPGKLSKPIQPFSALKLLALSWLLSEYQTRISDGVCLHAWAGTGVVPVIIAGRIALACSIGHG